MSTASVQIKHGLNALNRRIWWSNGLFFIVTHIAAVLGVWHYPPARASRQSLWLAVFLWQASSLGVTVGYHRLYSHRSFRATMLVRTALALLGASAFQGSIKWWCLRHRLHHRFVDDPVNDPYAATKGLFWSHMGWIFFKSHYERLNTIEHNDLDEDPVVHLQHRYYVPLALTTGFIVPSMAGFAWGDPLGSFVYAGLVSRLLVWHCTFLVNSLAHWDGLQPYSDDNTSRSNLVLALMTCGEGNHNFHSFPHDYRSGPSRYAWDPSKWVILLLHNFGLVSGLRRASTDDIQAAREYMRQKEEHGLSSQSHSSGLEASSSTDSESDQWEGQSWTRKSVIDYAAQQDRCIIVLGGYAVDVTRYLTKHPGGADLLRRYAVGNMNSDSMGEDADWAFNGGINKHTLAAMRRVRQLRIAKIQ